MPGSVERNLHNALRFWEQGRAAEDAGQLMRAGHLYTRGLGSFLSYVKLAPDLRLTEAYYAFGVLGRETARLLARSNRYTALQHARMALAASHLADPTRGQDELIERAVREGGRPLRQMVPDAGTAALTPEVRIAGAADARDLLAALLDGGDTPPRARGRWPIGSGPRLGPGPVGYWKEKKRFMQAVLPSCEGLDESGERSMLRAEAELIHIELRRVLPEFDPGPRPDRHGVRGTPYRWTNGPRLGRDLE